MKRWCRTFRCAVAGLTYLLRTQPNARFHAVASVAVITLAAALHLGLHDWCWLTLAQGMVWSAEAMNTALECLADHVSTERHPLIGHAKDAAAAAVLCAAAGATVIGVLVLGPPLWAALPK